MLFLFVLIQTRVPIGVEGLLVCRTKPLVLWNGGSLKGVW